MTIRLDVHHLEMVRALKRERTLGEAAQALRVTPSALSHRIREAERRLDVVLYQKQGRTLRPTAAAEILTDMAERLLPDLTRAEQLAVATAGGIRHVVRLTVGIYNSYHWLPAFLSWFRENHPSIEVDIEADAVLNPLEALAADRIDLVLTPGGATPAGFECHPVFEDELAVFTPPTHPFADRDFVAPKDFATETNLTYSMVREPGFEWDRFWRDADTSAAREVKIGSVEAICELVKAGLGVAILSRWALTPHLDAGTLHATRLWEGGIDIQWNVISRRATSNDTPVQIVATALEDWFDNAQRA